jgi:hypothetical protein
MVLFGLVVILSPCLLDPALIQRFGMGQSVISKASRALGTLHGRMTSVQALRFHSTCGDPHVSIIPSFPDTSTRRKFNAAETVTEFRDRRAHEENERAELRRANMAEISSDLNCAERRISAWEKMHGLRMPSDRKHPVLEAIAAATQLTLADVQNEQQRRSGGISAPQHVSGVR